MTHRQLRAQGIACGSVGQIRKIANGPYLVPSTRTPGVEWTVQSDLAGCNCPDSGRMIDAPGPSSTTVKVRQVCKHVDAVRLALEMKMEFPVAVIERVAGSKPKQDPWTNF